MSNLHLAHHLSLGSSMVRASDRSSEGCGFDPRLGLRNHFLSIELDGLSSLLWFIFINVSIIIWVYYTFMLAISILHKLALSAWFVHCPENASVVLDWTKTTLIEVCDPIVDVVKPFTPQISFFCIFSFFVLASLSHMFFVRCSVECIQSPGTRITKSIMAMLVYLTKDDYTSFVKEHQHGSNDVKCICGRQDTRDLKQPTFLSHGP